VLRLQLPPEAVRLSRKSPVPRRFKYILNWGNPKDVVINEGQLLLNKPENIRNAINKLTAFGILKEAGVRIPEFRTELAGVSSGIWFARRSLTGSGGRGIEVIRKGGSIPRAPLYVQYVPKTTEYRVHVVNGQVIFCQQKKRELESQQTKDQKLIRNRDNGWVFCLVHNDPPQEVKDVAVATVAALGLDYGAVDIVVGRDDSRAYVLECNTAPGISSPSLVQAYREAFVSWLTP
jgi:glutathione synthase/RimK-type ligase-like ATP-grasp enzyme